jgi:hypothetical protein
LTGRGLSGWKAPLMRDTEQRQIELLQSGVRLVNIGPEKNQIRMMAIDCTQLDDIASTLETLGEIADAAEEYKNTLSHNARSRLIDALQKRRG